MNREHLHAKLIRGFDCSRDGVRNVVKLEIEPLFLRRDVECDDDFVVCHVERSRDISVFRLTARDSSTSLGMTEQIAQYASPCTREDQSFTEDPWPTQRWFS